MAPPSPDVSLYENSNLQLQDNPALKLTLAILHDYDEHPLADVAGLICHDVRVIEVLQ